MKFGRLRHPLFILAWMLVLVGARLTYIHTDVTPTPFWDQWSAEAYVLFKPFLTHTLTVESLFNPHAEHRIFFTRVLALGLFFLNGRWDPNWEMIAGVGLSAGMAVMVAAWLSEGLSPGPRAVMISAVFAIFSLPFPYENILCGFQNQFYFLILLSLGGMRGLLLYSEGSARWGWGAVAGGLALVAMGSGVAAVLAVVTMILLEGGRDRGLVGLVRPGRRRTLIVCGGILLLALLCYRPVARHEALHAHGIQQFVAMVVNCLGWPWRWPAPWIFIAYVPWTLWLAGMVRAGRWDGGKKWIAAVGIWVIIQTMLMGWSRGGVSPFPAPRYMEILALGLLLNFRCLWEWRQWPWPGGAKIGARVFIVLWIGAAAWGLGKVTWLDIHHELPLWHRQSLAQERNVREFLRTDDMSCLRDKPRLEVPYPDADKLARYLRDPVIRSFLPMTLQSDGRGACGETAGGRCSDWGRWLLQTGPVLCGLGMLLLAGALLGRRLTPLGRE